MKNFFRIADGILLAVSACCAGIVMLTDCWWMIPVMLSLFLLINIIPSPVNFKYQTFRLHICADGSDLLISFLIAAVIALAVHIGFAVMLLCDYPLEWVISAVIAMLLLSVTFWNGIIRVYCTSVQLGLKQRMIGALCGFIPIVNIAALFSIIRTSAIETEFEHKKMVLNSERSDLQICRTKYPILLVHGVFFRDFKYLNYWGRVPKELERNGAEIYYGNHQSALSVEDSGKELAQRIEEIVKTTGCGKVNIIAHSKGGLDCRYAITKCGADKYVASLTTINTPHRGCLFADYLLDKAPEKLKNTIASTYNAALRRLGDSTPDFIAAVCDLTNEKCEIFNREVPNVEDVMYQSVGSKLNRATNGKFPLNFSYNIVKHFDGENDGLVSEKSFPWGSSFTYLKTDGRRGISHGDMIDLNRENIKGFDVREFYVGLVANLKNRGF